MNLLIDIGHPAHVHVFRYLHKELVYAGHKVYVSTRDKECTIALLKKYQMPFMNLGKSYKTVWGKFFGLLKFVLLLSKFSKKHHIDLFISISSMYAAQAAFLCRKPHLVLDDTEHSSLEHLLYKPFSKIILNPSSFAKDMGPKQRYYNGYHELAYLHPNYFKADPSIFGLLNFKPEDRYILIRFVSWNAFHDRDASGMDVDQKVKLVHIISKYGKVIISSEGKIPSGLESFKLKIPPDRMHDLLNYAKLYIGEGASMASEAAMLGTPSIYINPLSAGTIKDQEKYGLLHHLMNFDEIKSKAIGILTDPGTDKLYQARRHKMLNEKIDVTAHLMKTVNKSF